MNRFLDHLNDEPVLKIALDSRLRGNDTEGGTRMILKEVGMMLREFGIKIDVTNIF